jgi:uncharacterized membrane protein YfcA
MKRFFRTTLPVLAIGLGAGLLNGTLGTGGGVLIVLALRPLLREESLRRRVYPTALGVMLPLSALTLLRYWLSGSMTGAAPLPLFLAALAGGGLGALLLRRLSLPLLSRIFAAVVLLSGVLMVM